MKKTSVSHPHFPFLLLVILLYFLALTAFAEQKAIPTNDLNQKDFDTINEKYITGLRYYLGDCVEQDLTKAANLFFEAATQGHSDAMYYLGYMYHTGIGRPQNHKQAYNIYKAAALRGNSKAKKQMASLEAYSIAQDIALRDFPPRDRNKTLAHEPLLEDNPEETQLRKWLQTIHPAAGSR